MVAVIKITITKKETFVLIFILIRFESNNLLTQEVVLRKVQNSSV